MSEKKTILCHKTILERFFCILTNVPNYNVTRLILYSM